MKEKLIAFFVDEIVQQREKQWVAGVLIESEVFIILNNLDVGGM